MLGSVRNKEYVSNPFLANSAQAQPLGRFELFLYKKFQFSVLLCTSKPEFNNVVLKGPQAQNNTFCVTLLITWKLGLGAVAEAEYLHQG